MAINFFRRLLKPVRVSAPDTTASKDAPGGAEAQFRLGQEFAGGGNVSPDFAAAARCYREAAEQNHARAQFGLGMLYAEGLGVPRDEAQAISWIGKAAEQGNPEAQFNLGMRHYRTVLRSRSEDLPESRIEAYKWSRLAAAQGFPDSEATCNRMTLAMSRSEVAVGNQRAAAFLATHPTPLPLAP